MSNAGAYEASLRTQYLDARRRLSGQPAPKAVIQLPPQLPPLPVAPEVAEAITAGISPAKGVIASIARKHGLTVGQVTSNSRQRRICHARWECAFLLVVEHGFSLKAAGRRLNIDHASVLYGLRSHLRMNMDLMPNYAAHLAANSSTCSSIHREVSKLYFEDGWKVAGIAKELAMDRLEVEAIISADVRGLRRTHLAQARAA